MDKLKDHEVDIYAYRDEIETEFLNALDGKFEEDHEDIIDWAASRFPCIEVYRSEIDPERMIVEFLMGGGGPTVEIIWDSRWTIAKLKHSWGANPHTGEAMREVEFKADIMEQLVEWLGIGEQQCES